LPATTSSGTSLPPTDLFSFSLSNFTATRPIIDGPGLYVALDADCRALYVGQSGHVLLRVKQHADKPWAPQVAEWRYCLLPGGEDARLTAETVLVLRHRPRHNRAIKLGLRANGSVYELQFLSSKGSR